MRRTINNIIHTAGAVACIYAIILAIKAAGLADLGGDWNEMVALCKCSAAALAIGSFVRWWKI